MMSLLIKNIGLIAAITLVVSVLTSCSSSGGTVEIQDDEPPSANEQSDDLDASAAVDSGARRIEILMRDVIGSGAYRIEPDEILVGVGETVQFHVCAEQEPHKLQVVGLPINIWAQKEDCNSQTFTFEDAGIYEMVDMLFQWEGAEGKIIVE